MTEDTALPPVLRDSARSRPSGEWDGPAQTGGETGPGDLIRTFFGFSLFEEGYGFIDRFEDELSGSEIMEFASVLSEAGLFRESINLINGGMDRESWNMTEEVFELLFPKAYSHSIGRHAKKNGIDEALFYALVREESYFDPEAVSRAGAVGLSQLMPATADETARRIGMNTPKLTEPEDNLALGGYYFGSLLERFDGNPFYAVCAYNAGPTRMRRWAAAYGDLPATLMVEAIPIEETRNHAKKVLVSSALYGYLYGKLDPEQTIENYFSGRKQ